ncbi:nitrate regulatory protein [Paraglaciecola hydrolytica]|uniref:Nitrate-and nitrite-responsive positive regulator n=1 Tax=Paraglaciecola hydrolytica TaxID=1799789 RepID=A0A148KLZ2_9ALTE|nr:nitrate regulatory protein [Paraglaciecola hydrolytica]KXI27268.1 nitrate-and nitrite-responsive positive regulator [Paraglaciecola hydrolytica]
MSGHSDTTKRFLLAAKHAEISALQHLASNCQVVSSICELIHQFQKERGISNIFLSSGCERFAQQRRVQIVESRDAEDLLRSQLLAKYLVGDEITGNMRLLNSVTLALQGMDHVGVLRYKVEHQAISALESTQAYCRLVAGLLAVVFEAADVASDPTITRLLVALFNFIQAKEYAGQERAWGAMGFAKSHFDHSLCERLEQLQHSQLHSFDTFIEFANQNERQLWLDLEKHSSTIALNQMRSMIQQLADGSPIDSGISEIWYELATERIDQMHLIEQQLAIRLLKVAKQRVKIANEELHSHKKRLQKLATMTASQDSPLSMLFDASLPGLHGSESNTEHKKSHTDSLAVHHSFYDLLRDQSEHIRKMSEELNNAKRTIAEQKQIDRAKLLLMQQLGHSEALAYRTLQKRAMDQKIRIADMAELVIKAAQDELQMKPC